MNTHVNQLKEQFQKERIPKIDVTEQVMEQIYLSEQRGVGIMKSKVILVTILMTLLCATAFASIQLFQLMNKDGEVILELSAVDTPDIYRILPEAALKQYNYIYDLIPEREGYLLQFKVDDPETASGQRLIDIAVYQPETFWNVARLNDQIQDFAQLPEKIGEFDFDTGLVHQKFQRSDQEVGLDRFLLTDQRYINKIYKMQVFSEVRGAFGIYHSEDGRSVSLSLRTYNIKEYKSSLMGEMEVEKIHFNDHEAFLILHTPPEGHAPYYQIMWIQDNPESSLTCTLRTWNTQQGVSKEELIEYATEVEKVLAQ